MVKSAVHVNPCVLMYLHLQQRHHVLPLLKNMMLVVGGMATAWNGCIQRKRIRNYLNVNTFLYSNSNYRVALDLKAKHEVKERNVKSIQILARGFKSIQILAAAAKMSDPLIISDCNRYDKRCG